MADQLLNIALSFDSSEFMDGLKKASNGLDNFGKSGKNKMESYTTALRQTEKALQDIAIKQGTASKAFQDGLKFQEQLAAKAKEYQSALSGTTAPIDVTQQATNKLTSSYNALGNSVNQLTREMPAFTYSVQTGFMAISNNVPALFDALGNLKAQNAALVASGQQAIPIWQSLGSAIFSLNTAVSIGITVFTVYGAKIFEAANELISYDAELERSNKLLYDNRIAAELASKSFEKWSDIYREGLSGFDAQRADAREKYEKRFQELVVQTGQIQQQEQETGKQNLIARNTTYLALQQNAENYRNELQKINQEEAKRQWHKPIISGVSELKTKVTPITDLSNMVQFEVIDKALSNGWDKINATNQKGMSQFKQNFGEIINSVKLVQNELVISMQDVANSLSMAIDSVVTAAMNGGDIGKALAASLFSSMGAFMKQWGTQLILVGLGAESLKLSLKRFDGIAAIAAGAALVAAGSAASATAQNFAKNQSVSSSSNSNSYDVGRLPFPNYNPYATTVYIDGRIRGTDIVISSYNQEIKNRRVR